MIVVRVTVGCIFMLDDSCDSVEVMMSFEVFRPDVRKDGKGVVELISVVIIALELPPHGKGRSMV